LPETPRVSKTTSVQLYPVFLSFYNGLADSQSLVVYPAWQPHRRRTRLPLPSPSFRTRHRGRTPHHSRSYRLWKRSRLWLLFSLMERSLGAQETLACIRRQCRSAALWTGDLEQYSSTIYKKIWKSQDTINLINSLNATCESTYLLEWFVFFLSDRWLEIFLVLFTLNPSWTVDRFGRKPIFIVGAIGMAVSIFFGPLRSI
jgi:hypothetical protein